MSRQSIIGEITTERQCQEALWGDKYDDTHTMNEWVAIAARHLGLAANDEARFRRQMIRLSALCLAAAESRDRVNNSTRDQQVHREGSGH